ncbi:MAG: hypothetical protein RR568_00380 [Anaerorhabdus sp.]|uniref:hypothetical protein n=1 Tax=Anaerorhabdus sp. TaxID=1872524 RepID=UPI002FC7DE30
MKKVIISSIVCLLFFLVGCSEKEVINDINVTQIPSTTENEKQTFEINYEIMVDPIQYFSSRNFDPIKEVEDNVFEITMKPEDWDTEYKYYYNFNKKELISIGSYLDGTVVPAVFYWGENQWYQEGTCKYYLDTGFDKSTDCSRVEEDFTGIITSSWQESVLSDIHSTFSQQKSECNNLFDKETGERLCESWVLFDENVRNKFYKVINEYMDNNYMFDENITSEKYIKLIQEQIDNGFR